MNEPLEEKRQPRLVGAVWWFIKLLVFPFRFAWLLIVWMRLRLQARGNAANERH